MEPKAGRNKIVSLDGVFKWIDGFSLQKEFDDGVSAMLANQKAGFSIPVKPAHKFLKDVLEHGENILTHEVVPLQGEQGGSILEHEVLTRDEEDDDDVDRETYIDNDMMDFL